MASDWRERIPAFCLSPSRFLSGTTADTFLAELLRELRDDRASYAVKVLLLSPLCEYPALLCPSDSVGEETSLELMSVFAQCPPKSLQFRCQLLVALTCVLQCSSCARRRSRASLDFLDLLLQISQDGGDVVHGDGSRRLLRATACECLREMEACRPGLLSQRLELLGGLRQQESSRLHQAFAGLQTLVLRNAVYQLTQEAGAGAEHLKALLGGNVSAAWEVDQDFNSRSEDPAPLASLILGPMGTVPLLHTGPDCKELRSALSSLLEDSYLLTPLCQAALLFRLTEVVAMVPGIPPAIFRAQLLRLLGTSELCLFHATLLMKSAFTDSLFSSEDEAFLLKRLVVLSQHPLLAPPEQLLHMDCILHFPENRPIGCGDEEALPVLLTPPLAAVLLPTVFNDGAVLLARLNLLSLVYLEEEEEGGGRGAAFLYEHVASLLRIVENGGGGREIVVTSFRAVFLFLRRFGHVERHAAGLRQQLCRLYLGHAHLAPHLINMADRTQDRLPDASWTLSFLEALQTAITAATPARLTLPDLRWHLTVLARVAEEGRISQRATVRFLSAILTQASLGGDWRRGNGVLAVCRRLLVHPGLDALLVPLADVLLHLACRYGDTDIQDHARLYYTLLTTLSRDKLATVMAPGAGEGGRQEKKRTLSCLMAESEGLAGVLTVHRADEPVLRLAEARCERRPPADGGDVIEAALQTYRDQLADVAAEITLTYRLTHSEGRDPRFDHLFSIRLHFQLTDDHYGDLQDVSVPCLFRERPSPTVTLRLKPRRPYPTTLRVGAVFTATDGLSWCTALPDVHVAFPQVFLPLPAPPTWSPSSRLTVFQGLWDEMDAVSLFCCRLEEAALVAMVTEHFLPFLVSDVSRKDEFSVLIFLPPRSHVLLKIRPEDDGVVQFNMATDNWRLLPLLNSYLLTITAPQEVGVS